MARTARLRLIGVHGGRATLRAQGSVAGEENRAIHLYIVTIAVPLLEFRTSLDAVDGARLIRELPPRRVVVALRSAGDRPRLAGLPGVEAVFDDLLQQLHLR